MKQNILYTPDVKYVEYANITHGSYKSQDAECNEGHRESGTGDGTGQQHHSDSKRRFSTQSFKMLYYLIE